MDYDRLLGLLEAPPSWSPSGVPAIDEALNASEFFVHHEDVRRARPDWSPRPLERSTEAALWSRLSMARMLIRKANMTVKLVCPGFGQRTHGRIPIAATVTGRPSEVLLFCFGRQDQADVEVTGAGADRLRQAELGV